MTQRPRSRKAPLDPAQLNNDQVLRDREERIEAARRAIPDLNLNIPEPEPADAADFLREEWDRKTFGDAPETTRRIVYGPDPLFDGCPAMKAAIEKIGLRDYADATAGAILAKGEMAFADNLLRAGVRKAISKFGVEKVAEAFRNRVLEIPCREVEYEVDRAADYEVVGSKVLDEAVARYGRPGMAFRFLSERCVGVLGMRGYEIVKNENGEPVKCGTLIMSEIPLRIAERRRQHQMELASEAIESEVEKFRDEAERLAHASRLSGVGPLLQDELMTATATESESSFGESRPAAFTLEKEPIHA